MLNLIKIKYLFSRFFRSSCLKKLLFFNLFTINKKHVDLTDVGTVIDRKVAQLICSL